MSLIKATVVKVKALRAAGATYREIAQLTGLSMYAVSKIFNPPPPPVWRPRKNQVKTQRACLCCGRIFDSAGPMNRLCKTCRQQSVSPFDTPATVGRR